MNKKILVLFVFLLLSFNYGSKAQTLVHYWHFNNLAGPYNLPNIPGIAADFSTIDTSKAKILFAKIPSTHFDSSYVDNYTPVTADFDTVNARMSASAGKALRLRNPTDSMQLFFYIPTTGYQNIVLKYGCEKSNNGMTTQLFDYSVDSGATWKTSGLPVTSFTNRDTFTLINIAFTDAAVNNNRALVFRVKFSGNTISTSGNNRVDNVSVEGTVIVTNVHGLSAQGQPYTLYPNPTNGQLNIAAGYAASRSFVIYNEAGRQVNDGNVEGSLFHINTTMLPRGNYFITIRENNTGGMNTLRFTK